MNSSALADSRQTELAVLASEVNAHHQAAEEAAVTALEHARSAGKLLIEAKSRCEHGSWSDWLQNNFRGTERTAQRYMKLSRGWSELEAKTTRVSDLSLREAVKLLGEDKPPQPAQGTRRTGRTFAELPPDSRKSTCTNWFDIFAERVLLYAMSGMAEEEIVEITQMPERDVSLVLHPDPPVRAADRFDRNMGNSAFFVVYRKVVDGIMAGILGHMYQGAAWCAEHEGYPELKSVLEAQARLHARRAKRLEEAEDELAEAFEHLGESAPISIWCCALTDARIGLGIEPSRDKHLVTMFLDFEKTTEESDQ